MFSAVPTEGQAASRGRNANIASEEGISDLHHLCLSLAKKCNIYEAVLEESVAPQLSTILRNRKCSDLLKARLVLFAEITLNDEQLCTTEDEDINFASEGQDNRRALTVDPVTADLYRQNAMFSSVTDSGNPNQVGVLQVRTNAGDVDYVTVEMDQVSIYASTYSLLHVMSHICPHICTCYTLWLIIAITVCRE